MRVIRKTTAALSVAVGADEVLAWAPLPTGAKLLSVSGEINIVGPESLAISKFAAYGFSGYVIPVVDPTAALALKTTWDTMVVKNQVPTPQAATATIDYEWDIADTNEVIQPGRGTFEGITGMGAEKSKEIFRPRIEWMSFAKRPVGFVAGTPDTYQPISHKTMRSQMKITAEEPSYAMLAITNPALTEVEETPLTDGNVGLWGMGMHLKEMIRDFWRIQAGLIEAGAESPYADATTYIQELVAPDMLDESTTLYGNTAALTAHVDVTWVLEFPDGDPVNTLSA